MIILEINPIVSIIIFLLILALVYILFITFLSIIINERYFNKRIEVKDIIKDKEVDCFPNLKQEEFRFNSNNNQLVGNIYYYNNQREKIIIFANGYYMTTEKYLNEIDFFASLGYTVYCYDNTGTGKSEGKTMNGIPQAIIDLENCIHEIKKQFPNSEVNLVGHSMGGYAVCNVLNIHSVNKVIAIAPFNNIIDVVNDNIIKRLGKKFFLFKIVYRIVLKRKFKHYASYDTFNTVKYVNSKVLIIHGMEDKTVLVDNCIKSMMENQNMNVQYLIIDNKGHNPLLSTESMNYNLFLKHHIDDLNINYNKNIPDSEIKLLNENINFDLKFKFDEEVQKIIKNFLSEV